MSKPYTEDQVWKQIHFEIEAQLTAQHDEDWDGDDIGAEEIKNHADIALSNIQGVLKKAGYKLVKIDE